MKTLFTLALQCTLALCITSCSNFFKFSQSSTAHTAPDPVWSATIIENSPSKGRFRNLTLEFSPSGRVVAKCKTCDVKGFWYEDELLNKFVLCFEPSEDLCQLNKCWDVKISGSKAIVLKSLDVDDPLILTLRIA